MDHGIPTEYYTLFLEPGRWAIIKGQNITSVYSKLAQTGAKLLQRAVFYVMDPLAETTSSLTEAFQAQLNAS